MLGWSAMAESGSGAVGCFCPDAVLYALREAFGADLECNGVDQLGDHGAHRRPEPVG